MINSEGNITSKLFICSYLHYQFPYLSKEFIDRDIAGENNVAYKLQL
jgi:hypothetical protein